MVVCRFILRLHQVYVPAETILPTGEPSIVVGNTNAPLRMGAEDIKEPFSDSEDSDDEVIVTSDRPFNTGSEIP